MESQNFEVFPCAWHTIEYRTPGHVDREDQSMHAICSLPTVKVAWQKSALQE